MADATERAGIIELVIGMVHSAPTEGQLTDLITLFDAGASLGDLADDIATTAQFTSIYSGLLTNEEFTARYANNLLGGNVTSDVMDASVTWLTAQLDGGMTRPELMTLIASALGGATADPDFGAAATAFNAQVDQATNQLTAEPFSASVTDNVLSISGTQAVRIDMGQDNQIKGLDLDSDGVIENDGRENNITNQPSDFDIVDAYARNPLNESDSGNNFLGNIYFDGTGFQGDGTNTNGNIFLGGLGADTASGGIGNDFMAGGGVAAQRFVTQLDPAGSGALVVTDTLTGKSVPAAVGVDTDDNLFGGRNADFFFVELSLLDPTDGSALDIDGGETADDTAAGSGNQSTEDGDTNERPDSAQDSDWLLIEASDDDEPVTIFLGESNAGGSIDTAFVDNVGSDTGTDDADADDFIDLDNVENVDASGNLYGFLDALDARLGAGGTSEDVGGDLTGVENQGIGSSAQLHIIGNSEVNRLIGGYDNDLIEGGEGADVLLGGNMRYNTNDNSSAITNDGMDELFGGSGNDQIMFEMDGGIIDGGGDHDTLWINDFVGGLQNSSGSLLDDDDGDTIRIDLGGGSTYAGYGGADAAGTQDQSNYENSSNRVNMDSMESVNATGLGLMDFDVDGGNDAKNDDALAFTNMQNFDELGDVDMDLRGSNGSNSLYASDGDDVLEGREGNDNLMGGQGSDDFIFNLGGGFFSGEDDEDHTAEGGDDVDVIHRLLDTDGDQFLDGIGRDFNLGGDESTTNQPLILTNIPFGELTMRGIDVELDGVVTRIESDGIAAAANVSDFADALNAQIATLVGAPALTAVVDGDTIEIRDAANGVFTLDNAGWLPDGTVPANSSADWNMSIGDPVNDATFDRLIYQAYEDRFDGEKVDDDAVTGSTISLGTDAYAEDLVISFEKDSSGVVQTRIAEDQSYSIFFDNLTTEDVVTITVNQVTYQLQVGVDIDGTSLAAEDDNVPGESQAAIQDAFLVRFNAFINSFMDDDTAAGQLVSTTDAGGGTGDTLTFIQKAYHGEETVFMRMPAVEIENRSNGEPATYGVTNNSSHEVHLVDYDGRSAEHGELDAENVLFLGDTGVSQAILSVADVDGGDLLGSEADVIDGGADDLAGYDQNMATNADLDTNFSVHGDDLLIGGDLADNIMAGTGDDRVHGSLEADTIDGGKNWVAVKILGEAEARVVQLNAWETANAASLAQFDGLTISSVDVIMQTEDGSALVSGVFDDTLLFQQEDFKHLTGDEAQAEFTIVLDRYDEAGGVVSLTEDGAGHVHVDVDGDGTSESTTLFTNFENIRTVSGTGFATADAGQGNDTLDVSLLSGDTGGVSYDLTGGPDAGDVSYSTDAHADVDSPSAKDFETLVMVVDGVENVIGGEGDDLLFIDETEAAKHNTFNGGAALPLGGDDRIIYSNDFDTAVDPLLAEADVTIKVGADNITDTVEMTAGRVGTTVAVDTLINVEQISLEENTAASSRENDTLDVTALTAGAIVNYSDGAADVAMAGAGTVRTLDGEIQVEIEGMVQLETVLADGDDTVIVADAATMNDNSRSDEGADGTPSEDIALATYLDFDELAGDSSRIAFVDQDTGMITNVINQNQFTFDLSHTGDGNDVDTVDYSMETGDIAAVMNFNTDDDNQYVLVDGDSDGGFADAESRVDHLIGVEQIVASMGESIIDLTASTVDTKVQFSFNQPDSKADFVEGEHQVAAIDRQINTVRVSDADNLNSLGNVDLLEYRDLGDDAGITQMMATWNSVEGSDNNEFVELTQWEDGVDHVFNLRGGDNEVNYNERTNGIVLEIDGVDETIGGVDNQYDLTVAHLDATGTAIGSEDSIFGYNQNSATSMGTMRIEASQGDLDLIDVSGVSASGIFLVGNVEDSGSSVVTATFDGEGTGLVMSGFEYLWDGTGDDTYVINDLSDFVNKLTLIDYGNASGTNTPGDAGTEDRDTVKLTNGSFETAAIKPPIAHGITIDNVLHMGDADADDLQWLGVNNITDREELGNGGSVGFDFEVLDVSEVTNQADLTATGAVAGDEIIVGDLGYFNDAAASAGVAGIFTFSILSLTNNTNGTSFELDLDAAELQDATNTRMVAFDGDALDASRIDDGRDLTITVTDTGPIGATVIGGSGDDSITTDEGDDELTGGMGADALDGGFVAEMQEVHSYVLTFDAAPVAGGTLTIDGITITEGVATQGVVVADNDADAYGAAFVREWDAGAAFTNAASIASVTYDDLTNSLDFTFTSVAGDVADGLLGAAAGTIAAVATAETVSTAFTARAESADDYNYLAAAESTAASMDTISNFDDSDEIDLSVIDTALGGGVLASLVDKGDALDFNALTAAGFFGADDIAVGSDATDAMVWVDINQDGDLDSGDMQIKIAGQANADFVDTIGDFIV